LPDGILKTFLNFGGPCNVRFGIFYGNMVYFVEIWYIFPREGKLYQETSGNPAPTV
jgi:hypothetical protein